MEKRWICGLLVLVVLLALGLWIGCSMEALHSPVTEHLNQAARFALQGDMVSAQNKMSRAEKMWHQYRWLTAAVTDHSPMEEIDSIFSQLESYGAADDRVAFASWCSRAGSLVEAIGQAHKLNWQNLL